MKFKALGIKNFRPYFGSNNLTFSIDEKKPITLVRAPNNWGKTSAFEAIRWCLYGHWPDFDHRGESINEEALSGFENSQTPFEVAVTLDFEHENETYRVERKFKYSNKINTRNPDAVLYIAGVSKDGSSKTKLDGVQDFQLFIENILPENISKYFIVDGDDFKSFTDPTSGGTKEAIEHLLNLELYNRAISHLSTVRTEVQRSLTSSSSSEDMVSLGEKIEEANKAIRNLRVDLDKLEKDKNTAYGNYNQYKKKLDESTTSRKDLERLNGIRKEMDLLKLSIGLSTQKLADKVSGAAAKHLLKNKLIQAKLKLSKLREPLNIYPFDRPLLNDIVEGCDKNGHIKCVCGSEIKKGGDIYTSIKEKLKTSEGLSTKNEANLLSTNLDNITEDLLSEKKEIETLSTQLLRINQHMEGLKTNEKSIVENSEIEAAQNEQALAKLTNDAQGTYEDASLNFKVKNRLLENEKEKLKELEKKFSKIEKTDHRTKKMRMKFGLINRALDALNEKYDVYRIKKRKELKKTIREILFSILTGKDQFKDFIINEDYNYDVIHNNGRSWKRNLSNGQRKLLSVSFVAGLKNVAEEDAPYVIDSPLNAVSGDHQRNYAKILPDLSTQLILFVTETEITEESYNILNPKIGKESNITWSKQGNHHRSSFNQSG